MLFHRGRSFCHNFGGESTAQNCDRSYVLGDGSFKLGKEGYKVLQAYTIAEAKRLFLSEVVDLVISDITLPDGNGLNFGEYVRSKSNAVLIYLTAMDQEIAIVYGPGSCDCSSRYHLCNQQIHPERHVD